MRVTRGKQIEKMRRKLEELVKKDVGNEIITEEIKSLIDKNDNYKFFNVY